MYILVKSIIERTLFCINGSVESELQDRLKKRKKIFFEKPKNGSPATFLVKDRTIIEDNPS